MDTAATDDDNGRLYGVLNFPRDADANRIHRHAKILQRIFHPDKCSIDLHEDAQQTFLWITLASNVLSDPVYRQIYDIAGLEAVHVIKKQHESGQASSSEDLYIRIQNADTKQDSEQLI